MRPPPLRTDGDAGHRSTVVAWREETVLALAIDALPADKRDTSDLWERFSVAICGVTGADPKTIVRGSPLLSESRFWAKLVDLSALVWIIVAVGFVAAITARGGHHVPPDGVEELVVPPGVVVGVDPPATVVGVVALGVPAAG